MEEVGLGEENPGEVVEFSFRTRDGGYLASTFMADGMADGMADMDIVSTPMGWQN